jgi:molybdate transport system permease protein
MSYFTALEIEALTLSLRVAFWAMLWSLPLGIGVAWLLARRNFPGKSVLDALVHVPLVVPPVVVGYVLLVLFGRRGAIGAWLLDNFDITVAFTWRGAAIASAVMGFPLMVRAIRLSMEAVDPGLEAAARTLGAGPIAVFLTITLPLAGSGILAGAILAFARGLGEFGATITFVSSIPGETRTLPIALYGLAQVPGGEAGALRIVVISVALAFAALFASEIAARRMRARIQGPAR